jgi:pyruvate dehydrogenase E2 component (dihydrolipoamide acetyltransferase)
MSDIIPIVMPKWGLSMEEGTLTSWLVNDGTEIRKGQEIAEIESTKIANVFESPMGGTVRRVVAREGDVLPVGALLAVLAPPSVTEAEIDDFVKGFVVVAVSDEEGGGGIQEQRINRDGRSVAYKLAGQGQAETPVVLIHGFGGDSDNWLFNIEELAKDRPVYAIDLPGHGKSSKGIDRGDLSELADAVLAVMDATSVAKAHLVGHSLGGAVALAILQDHPNRVASVTGLAPVGLGEAVNNAFIRSYITAEKRRDVKAVLQKLFADPELISAAMIEGVQRFKRLEGARAALEQIANTIFPGGHQAHSFRQLMNTTSTPLLVIWGDRDVILDPSGGEGLAASVSAERLANVGHMPHMEAASKVNARLAQHFKAGG